jgi:hypothetical protein
MADKKEKKKEAEIVGLEIGGLIALIVVIAAWPSIVAYFQKIFGAFGGPPVVAEATAYTNTYWPMIVSFFQTTMGVIIGLSFPVAFFFLIAIVYCVEQLKHIRKKEDEKYSVKVEQAFETDVKQNRVLADRWGRVQKFVTSDNSNDWRQAILEADIMLEDVLTSLGYQGEGIGEKLRRVEKGDMKSLEEAGEAHGVRNRVAHDGAAFPLTQHEALRVINMYKKVFEEFYYI